MNNISNNQMMNHVFVDAVEANSDLIVLTSDSRGSAKLTEFGDKFPNHLIEVGIAEQNIVGIAAGLAHSGKRPFAVSPAPFLSMRSIEQIKVDVAYSKTNVKLVGVSGGVSYAQLGMSHHSLQDFAVTRAIPNIQVLCPADRYETEAMFKQLLVTETPAYIRLGRNAVEDVYESSEYGFEIGKANLLRDGTDVLLIGIGETVRIAIDAALSLAVKGISAAVLNISSLKPFDSDTVIEKAKKIGKVITIEEHSIYGGLGSAVAECLSIEIGIKHKIIGFPDEELVTGSAKELFNYYGLNPSSIADEAVKLLG
ncbi:transketolase family protein [Aerococcaceae bacterium zg-BR9]|uniref:transketolase family protein n=1 Tax=Aerococcaceae bacterium zg-1292 TaxID=2774330 RepID=UPI0040628F77|nr:transketolase family protein [Aerococcaceae bacterium zg-BR9]